PRASCSLWRKPFDVAQERAQVALLQPPLDAGRGAQAHPPRLDEPRGGGLVELVALAIGRERVLVQLARTLPADHLRRAAVELQADVTGDVTLRFGDERVQRVAQR